MIMSVLTLSLFTERTTERTIVRRRRKWEEEEEWRAPPFCFRLKRSGGVILVVPNWVRKSIKG
jgi:hypothetical protein